MNVYHVFNMYVKNFLLYLTLLVLNLGTEIPKKNKRRKEENLFIKIKLGIN
jgi:hypothetical protein